MTIYPYRTCGEVLTSDLGVQVVCRAPHGTEHTHGDLMPYMVPVPANREVLHDPERDILYLRGDPRP